jgi:hypothetical protein
LCRCRLPRYGGGRVGVWKLGGIFVHKSKSVRFDEKSTLSIRESAMQEALNATQENEAQQLAQAFAQAAADDFLKVARLLVASGQNPFGQTEFTARDILLRTGAKVYEQYLTQKKRLPRRQRNLPALWLRRSLSRTSTPHLGQPLGNPPLPPRLLLLPPLRQGYLPLRSAGGPGRTASQSRRAAAGQPRRHGQSQLRESRRVAKGVERGRDSLIPRHSS